MTSKRALTTAVATLAIASLAAFGCSKDKKKKADKNDQTKVAERPGAARAAAPKSASASAAGLAMFPKDANIYFGLNADKLRASSMIKPALPLIAAKGGKGLAKLKDCGIDLVGGLKSVNGGMIQGQKKGVFMAKGFTKAQFDACAKKAKDDGEKKFTMEHNGNITTITPEKGEKVVLRWVDDNTFIGGPKATAAELDAAAAGKGGLDGNPEMMKLVGKLDTSAAIYLAMQLPANDQKTPFGTVTSAYGAMNFDGGIKLDAGASMTSPEEAKAAVTRANAEMEKMKSSPFGKFASKVVLKANGSDVTVQLQLSEAEVKELEEIIKSNPFVQMMLQQSMGGGGGAPTAPPQ